MFIYMDLLAVIAVITFLVQVQLHSHSHYKAPETGSSEAIDFMKSLNPDAGIA